MKRSEMLISEAAMHAASSRLSSTMSCLASQKSTAWTYVPADNFETHRHTGNIRSRGPGGSS